MPPGRKFFDPGSRRKRPKPVGGADCGSNPEIARRQDVGSSQRKEQEHLRRPHPDSLHDDKVLDHLAIGKQRQAGKVDLSLPGPFGQIAEVCRFLLGQPGGTKVPVAERQNRGFASSVRCRSLPPSHGKDRARRRATELRKTILRASVSKSGSANWMRQWGPTRSMIARRTGSACVKCAIARVASVSRQDPRRVRRPSAIWELSKTLWAGQGSIAIWMSATRPTEERRRDVSGGEADGPINVPAATSL